MKHLLIIALLTITSLGASAQPPMQRPLPNQFRDFVDHQRAIERPQIERKDGKVVITMTEAQYKRMRRMKSNQRRNTCRCESGPVAFRRPPFIQTQPIPFRRY